MNLTDSLALLFVRRKDRKVRETVFVYEACYLSRLNGGYRIVRL